MTRVEAITAIVREFHHQSRTKVGLRSVLQAFTVLGVTTEEAMDLLASPLDYVYRDDGWKPYIPVHQPIIDKWIKQKENVK